MVVRAAPATDLASGEAAPDTPALYQAHAQTTSTTAATTTTTIAPGTPGADGLGDSFYPKAGNGGYDVLHYRIELDITPSTNSIDAVTTIRATATDRLSSFNLDLSGLTVSSVTVNDSTAAFSRSGTELTVTPTGPLPQDEEFTVAVNYSGSPVPITDTGSSIRRVGWHSRSGVIYVASEPSGAMTWFPCNNHPSDKATYEFVITVPETSEAAATGIRGTTSTADGKTTSTWAMDDPMATYLAAVYVGDFQRNEPQSSGSASIRNYIHRNAPEATAAKLEVTAGAIAFIEERVGTYPFGAYGTIVVPFNLGFALENQSLSIHPYNFIEPWVIAHEAAHQWFGNSTSLDDWSDIWLNEGPATYMDRMYESDRQGTDLNDDMKLLRRRVAQANAPAPKRITISQMFHLHGVYNRGALTLHALRLQTGDDNFFSILQTHYARTSGAGTSTQTFLDIVQELAGAEAVTLVRSWLYDTTVPALPVVLSVRGDTNLRYSENGAGSVATFTAVDAQGTAQWSLSGSDAASFAVSAAGVLSFSAPPDFENPADSDGDNVYLVTVEVSDDNHTATLNASVTVTDVNEPPEISGSAAETVPEGTEYVTFYSAQDPENAGVRWTLSGPDRGDFNITADGNLSFASPPNFEAPADANRDNDYRVRVTAIDPSNVPGYFDVSITVTDLDEPGTVSFSSAQPRVGVRLSASLREPDRGVSDVSWSWDKSADLFSWSPIDGATSAGYSPVGADLGSYLRATVFYSDTHGPGQFAEGVTATTVLKAPPPPPPPPPRPGGGGGGGGGGGPGAVDKGKPEFREGSRASRSVAENRAAGAGVGGPVSASDPDNDQLTYTLSGADAGSFTIDTSSGQVRTGDVLDYETRSEYTVIVSVSDGKDADGGPDTRSDDRITVTIRVNDRNDPGAITLSAPTPRVDVPLHALLEDPDRDVGDVAWVWQRSADRNLWTAVDGAAASYTPTEDDFGQYLRIAVSYRDRHAASNTATEAVDTTVTKGITTDFADVYPHGFHTPAITALAHLGVFADTECEPDRFCPRQPLYRWGMAVWLIRILEGGPTLTGRSRFADIPAGQWWIRHVESLADRGITVGCATDPLRYCPDQPVTRAQMATFLVRALRLEPSPEPAGFADTEGNAHAPSIDSLHAAGITAGCDTNPLRFCPGQPVTRAEMATFLHRASARKPLTAPDVTVISATFPSSLIATPSSGVQVW